MWSTCGARPAGRLGVERGPLAHAEAVLLVDHRERQPRNSTAGSISACVPTTSRARRCARRPRISRRRAAGVAPVSSAIGTRPPSSRSRVARCCSASVSVGAISAAWAPLSIARSIAWSATTVLPDPTSPISRRCMGSDEERSASIRSKAVCWSRGERERQRREPGIDKLADRLQHARRPALAPRPPPRRRASSSSNSSSKASRRRASSSSDCSSGKCAAASAAGRSASRSAARM